MSLTLSNMSSKNNVNVNVVDNDSSSSSTKFPQFPSSREREEFDNWKFKVDSFLTARSLLSVIEHPIALLPDEKDKPFSHVEGQKYIGVSTVPTTRAKIIAKSNKVYDYLVQSLHPKQIELVRNVYVGNAYVVMSRLKSAYGHIISSTSQATLMTKLTNNRKSSSETMTDYLARTDRIFTDLQHQDQHDMSTSMKKHFIMFGLSNDTKWQHITTLIRQIDVGGKWTLDQLKQYLIDEENRITASSTSSTSSTTSSKPQHVEVHDNDITIHTDDTTKAYVSHNSSRGSFRGRSRGRPFSRGRGGHFQPSSSSSFSPSSNYTFRSRGRGFRGRCNRTHHQSSDSSNVCFTCGKPGHRSSECFHNPHANVQCFTCGKMGHLSTSCYRNQSRKRQHDNDDNSNRFAATSSSSDDSLITNSRNKKKRSAFVVISNTSSAFHSFSSSHSSDWILDGGATDHYVSDINMMTNIRTLTTPRTIITANSTSSSNTIGTVIIDISPDHQLTLHDVLYLPDFHVNLISVRKITMSGAEVIYKRNAAYIMVDGEIDITFPLHNDMYMMTATSSLSVSSSSSSSTSSDTSSLTTPLISSSLTSSLESDCRDARRTSCGEPIRAFGIRGRKQHRYMINNQNDHVSSTAHSLSSSTSSTQPVITSSSNNITSQLTEKIRLLHLRHGHVNHRRLIKMIKKNSVIIDNMKIRIINERDILRKLDSMPCEGCLRGKMTRSPMTGTIDYHVTGIMQMWVFDTMTFKLPTVGGCYYITLTIDVYSSEIYIGLHKTKDEIADHIIKLIKRMQLQTGIILVRFHSDNGTEVKNAKLRAFFESQGTIHTFSSPYTPQHNSIVERKNQTVINMMLSIMYHARAYLRLYGEAAVFIIFILNRTTNTRTELITPIEQRTHRKPNLSNLHVWGCDVDYHTQKQKRESKLSWKSKPGIFVGYDEHNDRYYRIFDVDREGIVTTHEVVFHDDRFTEMKRLREIIKQKNDEEDHDDDITAMMPNMNKNDYLSDEYLDNPELMASMFGDDARTKNNEEEEERHDEEEENTRVSECLRNSDDDRRVIDEEDNEEDNDAMNEDEEEDDAEDSHNMNVDDSVIVNVNNEDGQRTVRRSSRVTARPFRFDGYSYTSLALDEPITYKQAVESEDSDRWRHAMKEEFDAHHKNKTWSIVPRRDDMNIIGCKWVYKIKRDANGNVAKYKARLVAKGFNQQYGIDYEATFAPVMKYKSMRIILALALYFNLDLEQLDVKTAFLNASVKEDIYVSIPEGMNITGDCVLKLNRALYGIKQAPREWHAEIHASLIALGYTSCLKDSCIYWKKSKSGNIIILGLFVDDIVSAFSKRDINEWRHDKYKLKSKYEMSELGEVSHILGMRVKRTSNSILITQDVYVNDKLKEFNFDNAKTVSAPETITRTSSSATSSSSSPLNVRDVNTYRQMVGSLMYASYSTRPDITHATNMVARHMSNPTDDSIIMVKRIYRYLAGARSHGLLYKTSTHTQHQGGVVLSGYCDADWGGDLADRKSTTGYCTFINDNLISWQSKKQTTVALSSTEAEYMAICDITKEIMWMQMILSELHMKVITPTIIYVDNQSAIKISENDIAHERTKHIDIKHYFVKDAIEKKIIQLKWISTEHQLADIFTKALPSPSFTSLRDRLIGHPNQL